MKLYLGIFLAVLSMPLASMAGIFAMELGYVWNIRQALGVGVLVGSVILLVALILFLAGVPSTLQRLRAQANASN
ncbi:hypothetical protein CXP47_07170 [Pseudomonas chlororaphis]|uniref:Uncharacterized protein n=1 Tax=Pseudomonas chlororaphis TaxID=587753 RepID=A0AAP9VX39_9PSED|nr:hypothetical protein [Pseudomonas chlororaphis]AUG39672.1 hypothetical protein CXP47_07170 [Pseudomonas chlororaphis]QNR49265.1 hypothetical protein HLB40_07100 [Pseudomonas chlororaphis]